VSYQLIIQDMPCEKNRQFNCLGVNISAINISGACETIETVIAQNKKKYICVCPVSTVIECQKDRKVLTSVNSAALITPDGMPLVWMGKLLGFGSRIERVYGPDLMLKMCAISAKKGYRNFFFGSSPTVINKLREKLSVRFPGLCIVGVYSPPFRKLTKEEDENIVVQINSLSPDIIWVGLGSPKQDIWMYEHRDKVNASLLVGVGAAFDFIAGTKRQAPCWMQRCGLEWLFRLIAEPKRLWKRYLIGNSLFILLIIGALIKKIRRN
jgi:N-acetylglucosaminyldiphosphoundecaprenol N-acetyl-beta-D-mannosaminyltransferase